MAHLLSSVNKSASDAIQPDLVPRRLPDVGEMVIYHMRAGHGRQGRTRFPALVQMHGERGTLGLTVILEAAELKNETLVEEIGPGKDSHVWERPDISALAEIFRGALAALHERIEDQETSLAGLERENSTLRQCILGDFDIPKVSLIDIIAQLEARVIAVEKSKKAK